MPLRSMSRLFGVCLCMPLRSRFHGAWPACLRNRVQCSSTEALEYWLFIQWCLCLTVTGVLEHWSTGSRTVLASRLVKDHT